MTFKNVYYVHIYNNNLVYEININTKANKK